MTDEAKVGHGWAGGPGAAGCGAYIGGNPSESWAYCDRPRSAHPAEERINWIERGQHERVALPDLVAELAEEMRNSPPTPAGITEQASEEEIEAGAKYARRVVQYGTESSEKKLSAVYLALLSRVRSEGGGEKGWQQGYRAGLEAAAFVLEQDPNNTMDWTSHGRRAADIMAAEVRALPIPAEPR